MILLGNDRVILEIAKSMKNKKKLILTIILSLVAVAIFVVASVLVSKHFAADSDGQIQVQLIDLDGKIEMEKKIDFEEGEELKVLLEENFENVVIENGMIMSIESFDTAPDWSVFISIYVNGEMSQVGLLDIEFSNGTVISFVLTEFIY